MVSPIQKRTTHKLVMARRLCQDMKNLFANIKLKHIEKESKKQARAQNSPFPILILFLLVFLFNKVKLEWTLTTLFRLSWLNLSICGNTLFLFFFFCYFHSSVFIFNVYITLYCVKILYIFSIWIDSNRQVDLSLIYLWEI